MPIPDRVSLSRTKSFRDQLNEAGPGPVVLINTFTIDPADAADMLEVWRQDSLVMRRQPGFIAAQLHEGIAESGVYCNYAVWESAADLEAAVSNPEFLAIVALTPAGTISRPQIFRKVAVPGICVD